MRAHRSVLVVAVALVLSSSPLAAGDDELDRIAAWMTGSFDTYDQVARDEAAGTSYRHLRAVMHLVPVTIPGLCAGDGCHAFYLEQAAADAQDQPYRQRVYLLTRADGRAVNRIFRIADPADLVGAWRRPELLGRLTADRVALEPGCDLVWERVDETRYRGTAGADRTCRSQLRGATHTVSRVELTATGIVSLDQGFDDAGERRWGPPTEAGGHEFVRRDPALAEAIRQRLAPTPPP